MSTSANLTVDVHLRPADWRDELAAQVGVGLTADPKELSPVWFYDAVGSALFDEITRLPEYYLTRAERSLLVAHAGEIAKRTGADTLVELGSGTSEKTRILLDALAAAGHLERYVPFDVDQVTMEEAAQAIGQRHEDLLIHAVVGDFHRHLDTIPRGGRRLVAFLGSTIGNLRPEQRHRMLFDLDCSMSHGDWLLLGVDLVKDTDILLAAYDDSAGVTAEFNRNALRVLNDRLGADFEPDAFEHVARWDTDHEWIEMHLRATRACTVELAELDTSVSFAAGETVRTEISAKFTEAGVRSELWEAGFVVDQTWRADPGFLLVLAHPYC